MSWLLLRGLARECRHWEGFPQRLSAALGEEVRCLDLPGAGQRHRERCSGRIGGIVEALRQSADLPAPLNVLALSLGGMVALDWLSRYPGELHRLVLLNTSLGALSPPHHRLRPANLPSLLGLLARRDPLVRERRVLAMTSRRHGDDEAMVRRWAGYARERPMAAGNVLRQLLAAARYRTLPALPPGALGLVLASAADGLVDHRCSRRLAARLGWPLRVHPGAGHDLALDAPEWVAAQVKAWVGGLEGSDDRRVGLA